MTNFGLLVKPDSGKDYILDENSTSLAICAFQYGNIKEKTDVYIPQGYKWYANLSAACRFQAEPDGRYGLRISASIESIGYLDQNRQLCFKKGVNARGYDVQTVTQTQQLIVMAYPSTEAKQNYGIAIGGMDNFFIADNKVQFANVVWKGDIILGCGETWLVSYIDKSFNASNTVVFFYCQDPSVSVGQIFKYDTNVMGYTLYDHDTGEISYTKANVKCVVFKVSDIKLSNYGIAIFNSCGKQVYDSSSEILQNPNFYKFNNTRLGEMVSIPGIKRPMFPVTCIGAKYELGNGNDTGGIWDISLRSDGFRVSTTCQLTIDEGFPRWSDINFTQFISGIPVMFIDAENYFNF